MAEATIKDLIKEIRVSNNMTTRIEEATLGATESVQRSIADLNTMLGKYFLAQNASRGDDLEAQREAKRNAKMKSGPTQAPSAATAGGGGGLSNFLQGLGGFAETAMFGLFAAGGAAGGAAAAIGSEARMKFLKRLARAPLIGAVALFSEEIVTSVFKGLTGKDIEGEQLDMFTNTLNATLLGSMFGRKGAFAGFMYSVISQSIAKTFPNKDDDESAWQKKTNLLGVELPFTNEDFAVWGGTIASFFAPSLITGAIRRSLGIGAAGKRGDNAGKRSFLKGFKPNMNIVRGGLRFTGWAGLLGLAGYSLVQTIDGLADGNVDSTDWLNLGMTVASGLGSLSMLGMFGPGGLLVTAIAGLAIGGGYLLYNYFKKRQNKLTDEFNQQVQATDAITSNLTDRQADSMFDEMQKIIASRGSSREDRIRAKAVIQNLRTKYDFDFENRSFTREFENQDLDAPVFYQKTGKSIQLYNAEGKPVGRKKTGVVPPNLLPFSSFDAGGMSEMDGAVIDQLSQNIGGALFQNQLENFLSVYKDPADAFMGAKSFFGQLQKSRNADVMRDLLPPDMSGYSGGVGVLDMKDQSTNSSYTYAAGTDRIDPRDKALID